VAMAKEELIISLNKVLFTLVLVQIKIMHKNIAFFGVTSAHTEEECFKKQRDRQMNQNNTNTDKGKGR
jgi:hypothetical protein